MIPRLSRYGSPVPAFQEGFTLLEVLAAVALLAIAFALGLRAMSGAFANSARGEATTQAVLQAQSLLDMQGLDAPLRAGVQQGRFADGASWQLRTSVYRPPMPSSSNPAVAFSSPQPLGDADQGGGIDLFKLDLDVRYSGTRTLHFSTLKAQVAQSP